MTGLIRPDNSAITSSDVRRARASAQAGSADFGRSHDAAKRGGTFLRDWRASLRSADADWLPDRDQAVARSRDLSRNDLIAGAGLHRRINSAVGFNWRLSSKPRYRKLGISFEAARELGKQIETEWNDYANGVEFSADAERQLSFGQLLRMSAAHIYQDGEALGLVEWAEDEPTPYKTRLRCVDPDRLSNPNGRPDSATLRGGIERNAHGVRVRYWIRESHPADLGVTRSMVWTPWEVHSTPLGRPQVLHAFDKLRAGQSRGVSRLVMALKSIKAISKFSDHTVEAAALNSLFLGFVKSNAGPSSVSESFEPTDLSAWANERDDHYSENPITVDGVQLPVLGMEDEVKLETAGRDTTGFDAFVRSILRLIAAALGLTYEELSMDFSQTNYSSARAALAVAWTEVLALRELITVQIAQPFYVAWLEEAFDSGRIVPPPGAPDFYEAVNAYAAGRWVGPGRGYIDPTKEIDAAAARIEAGISTLEDECADQGKDWEEVQEQTARENAFRDQLGTRQGGQALATVADRARDPNHDAALDQRAA